MSSPIFNKKPDPIFIGLGFFLPLTLLANFSLKNILFFILFIPVLSLSQEDSGRVVLRGDEVLRIPLEAYYDADSLIPLDTNVKDLYRFLPALFNERNSLGNIGLAGEQLDEIAHQMFGYSTGNDAFNPYLFSKKTNFFYQTKIPYVQATYLNGPRKYQEIDLLFSENIRKGLNLTAKFNRFSSEGFYLNQKSIFSNFELQSNFVTKNRRYGVLGSWTIETYEIQENGGIQSDSAFRENLSQNKLGLEVNLRNATNYSDRRRVFLNQFFQFGRRNEREKSDYHSMIIWENEVNILDYWYSDRDSISDFYGMNMPADTNTHFAYDQNGETRYNSLLAYSFELPNDIKVRAGAKYLNSQITQNHTDTSISSTSILFEIPQFRVNRFYGALSYEVVVDGFNDDAEDLHIDLGLEVWKAQKIVLGAEYLSWSSLAAFNRIRYRSSILNWNNTFNFTFYDAFRFYITSEKLNLGLHARLYSYDNYVAIGNDFRPVQFDGTISGYQFKLSRLFSVKPFYLDLNLVYQRVENPDQIALPEWMIYGSLYYKDFVFKKALEWKMGFDYYWNSEYYANMYFPLTRSFYLQNENLVGNFPFIDVFLAARIKRAHGFLRINNLLQGLLDQNYMMVFPYPMPDRGFSFGVSWDFYN